MTLEQAVQRPSVGDLVILFELDATRFGGGIYRFTPGPGRDGAGEAAPVTWGGQTYSPVACEAEGFEVIGRGQLPRPKIRVANINNAIASAAIEYDDLIGATLKRYRTFRQFLDGQPDADPGAYYGPDVFRLERKSAHNNVYLEWDLAAAMDQEGKKLPGRQVLRTCPWRYRRWDASAGQFVYDTTSAACPYTGSEYFDATGAAVADPTKDRCGKQLRDCEARFGRQPLPFGGFPSVARVR